MQTDSRAEDIHEMAERFERENPKIAEAMNVLGISMERYEASLSALYRPRSVTSTSTEQLRGWRRR